MSTACQLLVSVPEMVLPRSQSKPTLPPPFGQTTVSVTVVVPEGSETGGVVVDSSLHPHQVRRAKKTMRTCFMGRIAPMKSVNRAAPLAYNVWRAHAVAATRRWRLSVTFSKDSSNLCKVRFNFAYAVCERRFADCYAR